MSKCKRVPRRLLALLLSLGMMISMLPAAAAAGPPPGEEDWQDQLLNEEAYGNDLDSPDGAPDSEDPQNAGASGISSEESEPADPLAGGSAQSEPVYASPGTIDNNSESVVYDTEWQNWQELKFTNTVGAKVEVYFKGTGIAIYGQKASNGPYMSAAVDGKSVDNLDFYNAAPTGSDALVGEIKGLENGNHTLTLVFLEEQNASSQPLQGKYQAAISQFVITDGTEQPPQPGLSDKIDDDDPAITYIGSWLPYSEGGDRIHFTNAKGAGFEVAFKGTAITLYGQKAFNGPIMEVYLDGDETSVGNADFYASPSTDWNQELWTSSNLENRNHVLKFVFSGNANENSKPSSRGEYQAAINHLMVTDRGELDYCAVSGKITDAQGVGLANAAVTIGGQTAATDSSGAFTFAKVLDNIQYKVSVTCPGYEDTSVELKLNGADKTDLSIQMKRLPDITGTIVDSENKPIEGALAALADAAGKQGIAGSGGKFTISGVTPGTYTLAVTADGYLRQEKEITVTADTNLDAGTITLQKAAVSTETLSSAAMDVLVDTAFPRVIQYTMKEGAIKGKVLHGQPEVLDTLQINGNNVTPAVTSVVSGDKTSITYTMKVTGEVNAAITMRMLVKDNTLELHITDVAYDDPSARLTNPVESIMIPNHSLISVRSTEANAALAAARLGGSTIAKGDVFYRVDSSLNVSGLNGQGYMYVFLSNSDLSAGISSNSDVGTGSAGGTNYRLTVSAEDRGSYKAAGAGSSLWYYDRRASSSDSDPAQNEPISAEDRVVGIRPGVDEMPYVKVVVTGDENGDDTVDWQDGAIAAREKKIIHIPAYSESIPDLVTTRIAMNFESQATNPFLTTLDNVKRVSLHSDGLGQSVLLKGYANEGHDSGHPDYFDIGRRMGGAADFNTMLTEGHKYGAEFGIHVNASEFYPEAKSFSEQLVRYDSVGGPLHYGWNWLDQGIGINGLYDLASGSRMERWNKLYAQVADRLDYVYVDVWGNNTSGTEDAWQTRKLSNEITSHSWRIVHEWGYANEWDSTFQHWVSDFTYGGYDQKGKLNSEIMRFLLNSHKDSFPPDFPTYGGAANAPLLGGPVMQGFEGWQGDVEYDLFIDTLYNQMIPTKFLQHYDIMKWVDAGTPVNMPYGESHSGFTGATDWTPEVQITLQSQDRSDTVVVTRGSDSEINSSYAYSADADKLEYRSRTITLNGKTILTGASDPGDFTGSAPKGNMKYLIPWYWDSNGRQVSAENEKLYHYSLTGGSSTWDLPRGWESLGSVVVYTLTDQGRTNPVTVPVSGGRVTLTAEAGVPYVVVKGENGAPAPSVEWSTGTHLKDVSFNGDLAESWTVSGSGSAVTVRTGHEIPMLKMSGAVSASQALTGLTPGQRYAAYVGVDNRSDARASISITSGGTELASNYTLRSVARNYVNSDIHRNAHPTEDGSSFFQNMYVFFTAPASGEAVLTLSREAGEGNTYFDDVRVVANESSHYTYAADGSVLTFRQDFENVAQGLFPFVIGPALGVNDGRTHLSELHAPYTQSGWDVKKMDDVLDGNWSLKINGLVGYNKIIYRTIPQNFHFEPGKTYTVSFQYQLGSEGAYDVVGGVGDDTESVTAVPLEYSLGQTAACTFTLIGDESGQTWFGIRSTGRGGNTQGTTGAAANFGGYNDLVLDNLTISVSQTQKGVLSQLVQQSGSMVREDYRGDWAAFETAREAASRVLADMNAAQAEIDAAANALSAAIRGLVRLVTNLTGIVTDAGGNPILGASVVLEDGRYVPTGMDAVTGAGGSYEFAGISSGEYKIKVTAAGYDVQTLDVGTLNAGETNILNVQLAPQLPAPYVNTFDTGDVSMMQPMAGNAGGGKDEAVEAVTYNGSGALQVTYNNSERNTVVDSTLQMVNGTMEVDVTPLVSGVRFGVTLRGQDLVNRIYVGPFDDDGSWGWNCFNQGKEDWSQEYPGPGLYAGITRHVKITLDGDKLSLWVDGVLLMDQVTLQNSYPGEQRYPSTAGYVGLNAGRNPGTKFIYDNLRIIPADEPEAGSAAITGTVKDAKGAPVTGAQITVSKDGDAVTRTTAAADGSFATLPLGDGSYTLTVTASGFKEKSVDAVVSSGAAAPMAVVLAADPALLRSLYNQYKDLEQGGYTDESWQALQAALAGAKSVLDQSGASDGEILSARDALTNAVNGLRMVTVNKETLRILFNAYNALPNTGYTEGSWNALQSALTAAAGVLSDPGAGQAEVDTAANALQSAYDALTAGGGSVSADKSALRSLYAVCSAIQNTGYTAGSWSALQTALAHAASVLNDSTASQAEADAAANALQKAYDGLIVDSENPGEDPTEPSIPVPPVTPVTPVTPSAPSGGRPSGDKPSSGTPETPDIQVPGSTQEVTVNPDGSKTTTITDSSNNTAAIITEAADGTVTTTVTVSPEAAAQSSVRLPLPAMDEGAELTVVLPAGAGRTEVLIPTKSSDSSLVAVIDGKVVRDSVNGSGGLRVALDGDAQIRIVDNSKSFQDVTRDNWYSSAVRFVSSHELFQGTSSSRFSPQAAMDRGMLVTVLWRLAGEPESGGSVFTDVRSGAWYAGAVSWAAAEGIVNGVGEGIFQPGGNVTREQVAVFLYRFARWKGAASDSGSASLQRFRDSAQVSSWAREAMEWAVDCGVINGADVSTLNPLGQAARAEVAAMLERFMSLK